VEHYRREAARLRDLAWRAKSTEGQAGYLRVAEMYELLAKSAESLDSPARWPLPDRKPS
jgi:hypothetical protein